MMGDAKILGRERLHGLLATPVQHYGVAAGGGQDPEQTTPAEAAGIFAGLKSPLPFETWMYVVQGDTRHEKMLEIRLTMMVVEISNAERWDGRHVGEELLRKLVKLALAESRDPDEWKFEARKAAYVRRDVRNWHRVWKGRYAKVYGLVQDLVGECERHGLQRQYGVVG